MEIVIFCIISIQFSCAVYVQTQYGWVRGVRSSDAISFYGIPYAQQPRRWEHAIHPIPWGGVLNATKPRPMCIQPPCGRLDPPGMCQENMSENCHFVNVFVPLNARQGNRKTVMVFIHGGDFQAMSGGAPAFNGEHFVNKGDVILVTFNYRLGVLGFLVTEGVTGNYGITDQRLVLLWVHNNIERFGGDRRNVTLFGQGAGAVSVAIHMTSPKSLGLFRNAILQSLPFSLRLKTVDQARLQGQNFTLKAGCSDLECLRKKSPWDILDAQSKTSLPFGTVLQRLRQWGPHVDGNDVSGDIQAGFRFGRVHDIPLLIGTTTADGADIVFKTYLEPLNSAAFRTILARLNPTHARLWYNLYTPRANDDSRRELTQFITDFVYTCPTRSFASDMTRINNTWVYAFGRNMDFLNGSRNSPHCAISACHGSELAYLFQNIKDLGYNFTMPDMQLSDETLIYWTNFAKLNNPNGNLDTTDPGMFNWYQYTGRPPVIRAVLGIGHPQSSIQTDYRGTICNMFDNNNFRA
ncbi:crystal protein-like [Mytilus galloprovincialis]|uniref:crystal protein-like n=1 Tax=Mytilus galloprovincialis TaxID=29158 RepID=UPI003F7B4FE7